MEFINPPPMITKEGVQARSPTKEHGKLPFAYIDVLYCCDWNHAGRCACGLTGVGSQYLIANVDTKGEPFDGSKDLQSRPCQRDIPAARFWSFTVYDNQSRSMLQTQQRFPTCRQPEFTRRLQRRRDDDGSTDDLLQFEEALKGVRRTGTGFKTDPKKGWFHRPCVLYSPLQSFL